MSENQMSRLDRLARNISAISFYSITTLIVGTFFGMRMMFPVSERIEAFVLSPYIYNFGILFLGVAIPGFVGASTMIVRIILRFTHGLEFETLYSKHWSRHRENYFYFIIVACTIEFLIDIWFIFE